MIQPGELVSPIGRRRTRLDPDQARRQLGKNANTWPRRSDRRMTTAPAPSTPCTPASAGAGLYGAIVVKPRLLVCGRPLVVGKADDPRGARDSGTRPDTLVFGRPRGVWTMIQRCASGAMLRATAAFS
jgi:hypothetical protein